MILAHNIFNILIQTSKFVPKGSVNKNLSLDQIIAWHFAPSRYLNQLWHLVNLTPGNKFQWDLNQNTTIFIQENSVEKVGLLKGGYFVPASMC